MQPTTAPTILVVEDDDGARAGLGAVLSVNGYPVATAADGRDALSRLASDPKPALVLLDMIMPILDGWRFMELRAQEPDYAAVPVVVNTGMTYASYEWALARGAVGIHTSPSTLPSCSAW